MKVEIVESSNRTFLMHSRILTSMQTELFLVNACLKKL